MRQVLRAGALGRSRGMGWRRRQEGGSGWGTHVNPWLIHVNVWQKPLEYCKVVSLQLIKINEKKKKKLFPLHVYLLSYILSINKKLIKKKAETLLCQQRSVKSKLWFYQWSCMDVRVGL